MNALGAWAGSFPALTPSGCTLSGFCGPFLSHKRASRMWYTEC